MALEQKYFTPITRYYIDTRPLVPAGEGRRRAQQCNLPLLHTLPLDLQANINRFMWAEDKLMSLASALLKFTFIHRVAKIPWSDIRISRTPKPHGRPYWDPPSEWHGSGFDGLEFNVSHQAGLVILAGCQTPDRPSVTQGPDQTQTAITPDPAQQQRQQIRIGVDVSCAKEPRRTQDFSTQAKLDEWVDTFSEMFSARERRDMKERPTLDSLAVHTQSNGTTSQTLEQKGRRFYTYWALKEAYIKMVGEGLLADWLRQLEFVNVAVPESGQRLTGQEAGMQVVFKGKDISNSVEVELEGFDESFMFTMVTRGLIETQKDMGRWTRLHIEGDLEPCAEGYCQYLSLRTKGLRRQIDGEQQIVVTTGLSYSVQLLAVAVLRLK